MLSSLAERIGFGYARVMLGTEGRDCACLIKPYIRVELLGKHRLAVMALKFGFVTI